HDLKAPENATINGIGRSALVALATHGQARIDRLLVANRTIAIAVTLLSGNTAWLWKIAYDQSLVRALPDVQLVLKFTHSLLADVAIARVDSCGLADHAMIQHMWRERVTFSDWLIASRPGMSLVFALACQIRSLRCRLLSAGRRLDGLALR